MSNYPLHLDVRPILRSGGEPFSAIMQAVESLTPGQGLRLLASFKPIPLIQVLGARGFEPFARDIGNGDWEVLFIPANTNAEDHAQEDRQAEGNEWPTPSVEIDCRDLLPPEPMVKVLEVTEALATGATMTALLPREPRLLFPELEARGHAWRGEQQPDSSYQIVIRRGAR